MTSKPQAPSYPIALPTWLSDDAQAVYRHEGGRLDRDLLDPKARRRYVTAEQRDAFEPSERMLAAINELVAVGLATYSPESKNLSVRKVHPQYTVAEGAGAYRVEVRLVPVEYAANPRHEGALLAILDGADMRIDQGNGAWALARLTVPHPTATDFEHDRVKVADLDIVGPTLISMYGARTVYAGTLIDARLWPLGTNPLSQGDGDTAPQMCNGEGYSADHEAHPFAAYLPAERDEIKSLLPSIVTVTLTPKKD